MENTNFIGNTLIWFFLFRESSERYHFIQTHMFYLGWKLSLREVKWVMFVAKLQSVDYGVQQYALPNPPGGCFYDLSGLIIYNKILLKIKRTYMRPIPPKVCGLIIQVFPFRNKIAVLLLDWWTIPSIKQCPVKSHNLESIASMFCDVYI